jgi:hypothetical protein
VAGVDNPGAATTDRGYNKRAFHENALHEAVIALDKRAE